MTKLKILIGVVLINASFSVTPGDLFNLENFSLQLPIDNNGGITTIKQPKLDSYDSTYFYVNSGGDSMVLFAPENGAMTDNGSGPRTELTEPNNFFTFSGKHKMSYITTILQADHDVCIGQVKGDSYVQKYDEGYSNNTSVDVGGSPLIVAELVYDVASRNVYSHVRDSNYNDLKFSLGKFDLNEPITINIIVDGFNLYVSSNKGSMPTYSYAFWKNHNYGMHFKVGVYLQGKGSVFFNGGKVKISNFKTSHA